MGEQGGKEMTSDSILRGLESFVAEFLLRHVAEGVFEAPQLKKAIPKERLEVIRREVEEGLRRAWKEGEADRQVFLSTLGSKIGGGTFSSLLLLLGNLIKRPMPPEGEEG